MLVFRHTRSILKRQATELLVTHPAESLMDWKLAFSRSLQSKVSGEHSTSNDTKGKHCITIGILDLFCSFIYHLSCRFQNSFSKSPTQLTSGNLIQP